MKHKTIVKTAADTLMSLALFLLMGYQFWGDVAHEWIGAGMFVLFITHHILNLNWYRSLFRGRYTPQRVLLLIIDSLVFIAMIGLMINGIMMSNHVFDFLNIHGGMSFARSLHMLSSYWGFIFMSVHLGAHWKMFMAFAGKVFKARIPLRIKKILLPVIGACISAYGIAEFIRRDLITYMLLQTHFVFFDYSEPVYIFYLDYLAIMGAFIFAAHYIFKALHWLLMKRRKRRS